ncbi:hypothetical protein HHK36_027140 [Tetracentron sinense]|uniref:Protein RALF-like 32 n=1 Tax=Tetracentron sinense TaxID=13715 RepID=A0A835D2V7_TETSI|nr:hypothetical protein HHK36_027140 [Tetracentron sinense]
MVSPDIPSSHCTGAGIMVVSAVAAAAVVASSYHGTSYSILSLARCFDYRIRAESSYGYKPCNGSIAECYEEQEEMAMESEISRRILQTTKYISPGALKPNLPICGNGARGNSYSSSCLPPQANPSNRGCSKYYRCRS